jgi:hypothetical protein
VWISFIWLRIGNSSEPLLSSNEHLCFINRVKFPALMSDCQISEKGLCSMELGSLLLIIGLNKEE